MLLASTIRMVASVSSCMRSSFSARNVICTEFYRTNHILVSARVFLFFFKSTGAYAFMVGLKEINDTK